MNAPKCPICRKAATDEHRPFCSARCANVDLQRWFTGAYVVPAVEDETAPDEDASED